MSEMEAVARDEFFDSLLGDFLDESGQLLERLNENLLQLDEWAGALEADHHEKCDEDLLNEMFRAAHSLKGLSGMLALEDINQLTHRVENVFDAARKDELIVTGDVVELMFQAIDRLAGLVEVLKDTEVEAPACEDVIDQISELLSSAGCERKVTSQGDAEKALGDLQLEAAAAEAPSAQPPPADPTESLPQQADVTAPDDATRPSDVTPADFTPETVAAVDVFASIEDEAEAPSKYLPIFIDEAEMSLDQMSECLLADEEDSDGKTLENLLVTAHRIKGSAASVGLNRAAKLAHLVEDALQELNESGGSLTPILTDAMLAAVDGLRLFVDSLKHGGSRTDHFNNLAGGLIQARSAEGQDATSAMRQPSEQLEEASAAETAKAGSSPDGQVSRPVSPSEDEAAVLRAGGHAAIDEALRAAVAISAHDQEAALVGRVAFQPGLALVGLKAQLVYEKLCNVGEICHFEPSPEGLDELEELDSVAFGLVTEQPLEVIRRQLSIAGVDELRIEPLQAKQPTVNSGTASTSCQSASPSAENRAAPGTPSTSDSSASNAASAPASGTTKAAASALPRPAAKATSTGEKPRGGDAGSKPAETLRVDIERLDHLMNLAGQLVISRARFAQIGDSIKGALGSKQSKRVFEDALVTLGRLAADDGDKGNRSPTELQAELDAVRTMARRLQTELETTRRDVETIGQIRSASNHLFDAIHQLDRVTDGIQQSVMDTRMLPIGPLFARFKRVVRDITRGNGKQIRLVINGEKTELDKRMIDELSDPLIHMVRNSADHGIELPEDRVAAGKPAEGTVTLDAYHRGNSIVIEVADDGKGLDPERIKEKAINKGLVTEIDAEKMSNHQIFQLIWEPGLSTAQKITEVSGRGMGMDIVKSKIEDLNGMVDLDSEPGVGTTLRIKLPLTLAILPSLMVRIDDDVFAMPLEGVEEIVSIPTAGLSTVYGRRTATVRGSVVGTVRLDEIFDFHSRSTNEEPSTSDETTIVIIGEQGRKIGLIVDHVIGEEDIVIKSMAENFRNVPGIAGASILGDGRVSLILDLAAVFAMASRETEETVATH